MEHPSFFLKSPEPSPILFNGTHLKTMAKSVVLAVTLLISPAYCDEPPSHQNPGEAPDLPSPDATDRDIAPIQSSVISRILSSTELPLNTPAEFLRRISRHEIVLSMFHDATNYMLQDIDRIQGTISLRLKERRIRALINRLPLYLRDLDLIHADFEEILGAKNTVTTDNHEERQRLSRVLEEAERRFRSLEEEPSTEETPDENKPPKTPFQPSQPIGEHIIQLKQATNDVDKTRILEEMEEELERIKTWSRTSYNENYRQSRSLQKRP